MISPYGFPIKIRLTRYQDQRTTDIEAVIETRAPLPHRGVEDLIARGEVLSDYRNNRRRGLLIGSGPIEASPRILNPTHEATSLESLPRPRCRRPGGVRRGDDA